MITVSELQSIFPYAGNNAALYSEVLNSTYDEFEIDTPDRQSAFLANVAVESAQLSAVSENLNYRSDRIIQMWPNRFPTLASALPYSHNPQALANAVYANRFGNGTESSGDGWRYRGAGLLQITFHDTHQSCADFFDMDVQTIGDWMRTPEGAARSAGWFWAIYKALNTLADQKQFGVIVRKITGGTTGLSERNAFWAVAQKVLG